MRRLLLGGFAHSLIHENDLRGDFATRARPPHWSATWPLGNLCQELLTPDPACVQMARGELICGNIVLCSCLQRLL
jgi:hypothetical protein